MPPPDPDPVSLASLIPGPALAHRRLLFATQTWTNTNALEFYAAAMIAAWGAWMLLWWALKGDAMYHPAALGHLFRVLPHGGFGLIGLVVGCGHLWTRLHSIRLRMFWLFVAEMFWSIITLTILVYTPASTGVMTYGGLALVVGICYLRLYVVHGELFRWSGFVAPVRRWWNRRHGATL